MPNTPMPESDHKGVISTGPHADEQIEYVPRSQLAEARAQRNALVNGIEAEIAHRRELARKNASLIHYAFADRLEEIRDRGLAAS